MSRELVSLKYHVDNIGITQYLDDDNVTEIMLNPDGKLWVEAFGQPMKYCHNVSHDNAMRVINAIADYHGLIVDKQQPLLECELPIDGSRFEALIPPLVHQVSFVLRKKATRIFLLEDYVNSGVLSKEQYDLLVDLIMNHRNILIVGGTGSGKTTLANAILAKMAECFPNERVVILEDTNEIQCQAQNFVTMRTCDKAGVSMRTLLRATLRYRPDRIIVGEVRGGEALDLLKAWNTGHPGGVATIHADSACLGLERLEQCISEVAVKINQNMIASTVHSLVSISKTSQGRKVQEIIQTKEFKNGNYTFY